jgi:Zn-dependent protease
VDSSRIAVFVFVFVGAIIGTCVHEFGHALAAYFGGDKSVKDKGYLTMNPLKYAHPLMSFGLPLLFLVMGGIPLPGGAVYIEMHRIPSRVWKSFVSLAGPIGTAVFTLLLALPFILGLADTADPTPLWAGWAFLIQVEIAAFFLNLLPVPPLDGFGIIVPFLPPHAQQKARSLGGIGIFIVFLVFWNVPAASHILWGAVFDVGSFLGVPPELGISGYELFRFWK